MIGRILDFRLKQIVRIFREIGAVYLLLLFLVCIGFFLGLIEGLLRSTSPWMGLIGVMIVLSIHFSRKDTSFLKKLEISRPKLYLWEYSILLLPMACIYLRGGNMLAILVQLAGILVIAFLPNPELTGRSFSNVLDFKILPSSLFEARAYLRRYAIPSGLVYILGLVMSQYVTVMIVMMLVVAMLFTAFFDEVEDKSLLEAFHFRKGILKTKTQSYLSLYFLVLLPYIVLFLILHLQYWYIMLAVLFLGSTLILFNIFYKYAHYAPGRRRIYNSMGNAMFLGGILIPFFYPVTLLYLIYYWRKARKNISLYYAKD